jgi:hypothetical protein
MSAGNYLVQLDGGFELYFGLAKKLIFGEGLYNYLLGGVIIFSSY